MKSIKRSLVSLVLIVTVLFAAAPFTFAARDEGMFTPEQIAKLPLKWPQAEDQADRHIQSAWRRADRCNFGNGRESDKDYF